MSPPIIGLEELSDVLYTYIEMRRFKGEES